jgi:hypothetical protein
MKNWVGKPSPKSMKVGTGWCGNLDKAYSDGRYAVMTRVVPTDWGEVTHACIRNTNNTDIPWAEKQRIKNELFGEESTAIEVFPAESELVDGANMYHIWVLPMKLPFGLR